MGLHVQCSSVVDDVMYVDDSTQVITQGPYIAVCIHIATGLYLVSPPFRAS